MLGSVDVRSDSPMTRFSHAICAVAVTAIYNAMQVVHHRQTVGQPPTREQRDDLVRRTVVEVEAIAERVAGNRKEILILDECQFAESAFRRAVEIIDGD